MKTFCRVLITIILCITGFAFLFFAPNAQATPYPSISGDNSHEWITNVTFGNINNTTAQNGNGYGDFTYDRAGFITRLKTSVTYPLRVTIHPDTTWCKEYIYAFFDWNHDGDFTDSGETKVVAANSCIAVPHILYVKVPWNAVAGETRMRIVMKYNGIPKSYGAIPEGEAEDYTILVEYPVVTGDNRLEWITNVTIGDINNTSGQNSIGYGDYTYWSTHRTTEVIQDETYSLSVTISPDLIWCNENVTAFLDWNHDGDFADYSERVVVTAKTCTAGPYVVNIKVPINAPAGRSRMRIILRWRYTPSSSGYISGEGEDYTLVVKKRKFPWPMFLPAITGRKK